MNRNLGYLILLILAGVIGCGGGWTPPKSAPRLPSIPSRVTPSPNLLQSLRVAVDRVAAQPETDEEEQEEREEAAEQPPGAVQESELATNWRLGLSLALAQRRLQVVAQGGARLSFDIRRARGSNFICDVAVKPVAGHPWKKRYIVDAHSEEPEAEAGPAMVVADLLQDPEFLAAVQGKPLPPGTGAYLVSGP